MGTFYALTALRIGLLAGCFFLSPATALICHSPAPFRMVERFLIPDCFAARRMPPALRLSSLICPHGPEFATK